MRYKQIITTTSKYFLQVKRYGLLMVTNKLNPNKETKAEINPTIQ